MNTPEARRTLERAIAKQMNTRSRTYIGVGEEDDPQRVAFFKELEKKRKREAKRK